MYRRVLIACVLFCIAALQTSHAKNLLGKAYDPESGELLYEEQHTVTNASIHTRYLTPAGQLIATREVSFDQDQVRSFQLTHHQLDRVEYVERQSDSIEIKVRADQENKSARVKTRSDQQVTIDAGFSQLILNNWDRVTAGEKLTTDFVSTERLDLVKIAIRQRDAALPTELPADQLTAFEMTLANPLLSWLLSPVRVAYYSDNQQLAFYEGASNLYRADGSHFGTVRILFDRQSTIPAGNAE